MFGFIYALYAIHRYRIVYTCIACTRHTCIPYPFDREMTK